MKTARFAILAASLLTPAMLPAAKPQPAEPVNALWNDHDGFGIWIYPGPGKCPEVRSRLTSFMVIGAGPKLSDGQSRRFEPQQLKLCAHWVNNKAAGVCKEGWFRLEYQGAASEYLGSYDLVMSDGKILKGSFRAQYCDYGL